MTDTTVTTSDYIGEEYRVGDYIYVIPWMPSPTKSRRAKVTGKVTGELGTMLGVRFVDSTGTNLHDRRRKDKYFRIQKWR